MTKKRSPFLQTPIEPFVVDAGLTADQVVARMERISFQGRNLATAHRVWQKMLGDDVTIFLGNFSGPFPACRTTSDTNVRDDLS